MVNRSIVEYFGVQNDGECGYCKSESREKCSHGLWAHTLTVENYQSLLDRGWRRSGKYCYKPMLNRTCCPQYTIRCDATQFKLSKSQKRVLKRMNRFLLNDDKHIPKGSVQFAYDKNDSVVETLDKVPPVRRALFVAPDSKMAHNAVVSGENSQSDNEKINVSSTCSSDTTVPAKSRIPSSRIIFQSVETSRTQS